MQQMVCDRVYDVMSGHGAEAVKLGTVRANNYSHARTKAMQLWNKRVWVRHPECVNAT